VAKPVEFDPEAREDFDAATDWYEERDGLGADFATEVLAAVARLAAAPESCSPVRGTRHVRAARLRRFKFYRVIFVEGPTSIRVLAVAHDRQRAYWKRRLEA
jgi:plasmid stabilization system protein ParE